MGADNAGPSFLRLVRAEKAALLANEQGFERLVERMRVVAPDLVGFGFTERPDGVDYAMDEHNAKLVSADMKKKVDAAKADIIAGKIKVADYMADNACKF